jgi:hypothetical protein
MSDPVKLYQEALAKAEQLKSQAIQFLKNRKIEIEKEVADLNEKIAEMTGEQPAEPKKERAPRIAGKQISFRLLADLLKDRPDRTINIRKEGYDSKWIKSLVKDNPTQLQLGGGGPWPTVKLIEN